MDPLTKKNIKLYRMESTDTTLSPRRTNATDAEPVGIEIRKTNFSFSSSTSNRSPISLPSSSASAHAAAVAASRQKEVGILLHNSVIAA